MAAGKNKITRWARLHVGAFDLSGDARTFAGLDNHFAGVEMGGWANAVHYRLADLQRVVGIRGFQAYLNDAAAGAWTVLKQAAGTARQVSLLFGAGAEPATGDPAYLLAGVQVTDAASFNSNAAVMAADFMPDAGQYNVSALNPWGVVLQGLASLAATTTGTAVDNGAATTAGGHANLHVEASSGGTWSLKVQHSTNNSLWVDLITFSANGSAVTSEHASIAGTINQYTRVLLTRTSGSLSPVIVFARN